MSRRKQTPNVPGALPPARKPSATAVESKPVDPPAASKPPEASAEESKPLRQNLPAPYCPYHKEVQTKANRSEPFFTRYYCPVKGCNFSQKVQREDLAKRVRRERDAEADFSAR